MDAADLVATLLETTIAGSAAVLLALALRRPLRRAFGSTIAYALWLLVPAAIIAVMLPATQVPAVAEVLVGQGAQVLASTPVRADAAVAYAPWLAALWMLGVVVMTGRLAWQQRTFCRRMGKLRWLGGGISQAEGSAGLPAVIGWFQPLIVLPADFHSRYTPAQCRLMQAHETMHLRSGDPHFNALTALLRCVFWFNPVLHMASRHFRHDQELACDQRVIARHPYARRDYGEAMLKTQLAAQPLPVGCHWGYSHPLKERIAMLKQPVPSSSRWWVGSAVLVALLVSSGVAAWAAQPPVEVAGAVGSAAPTPPPP
ncbi:MAG: M56 family metallopeptidase, partial [Pseudomonadota bacterium]|nr:M56 family metallopeptidase [Pseudomonadota bacterium]